MSSRAIQIHGLDPETVSTRPFREVCGAVAEIAASRRLMPEEILDALYVASRAEVWEPDCREV
jgi:hypothetical protein